MDKLKQRWNIKSNSQLVVILIVFAVNGSLSVTLASPLMKVLGMSVELTDPIIFWGIRVLLMFVLYQVLLVIVGTLFGQHRFFWNMEKKMLSRLGFRKILKQN